MSDLNQTMAFSQLLERCQRIEVPLIQRDYAQGRESEKDVRDDFLKALHGALALPAGDPKLPLNLDFIYGSTTGGNTSSFLPLDGQQRLTTLFLLHWYLAWQDGQLAEFQNRMWDGKHSRFTYGVRPSSTEFFDALVNYLPPLTPSAVSSIKMLLQDEPWFFLHWRLDPTIQAALTMLDSMHQRFKSSSGLYSRLINSAEPVITFQLLPLEHFGLSDDLYIKMNARGKPLTPFETFKARFEEHLETLFQPPEIRRVENNDLTIPKFFALRMDTLWTDFFWHYKDKTTNTFDAAVMNLFWAITRVSLDPASPSFVDDTSLLRNKWLGHNYTIFHDRGWLSRAFAENLITLLEVWSGAGNQLKQQLPDNRYFDESRFFQSAIQDPSSLEYTELAKFAAFVFFLRRNEGKIDQQQFQEWMRVVNNLAVNTDIERPEEFGRFLSGLQKLVLKSDEILQHLSSGESDYVGFNSQQLKEEIVKAQLILSDSNWRDRLHTAERHGYFQGQIEFLLTFSAAWDEASNSNPRSWSKELHADLQTKFDYYSNLASATFNASGLVALPGNLWRRALLSIGDYLIHFGSNYSFATDAVRNGDSWKRFLRGGSNRKRELLKSLWDKLDAQRDIKAQLQEIIAKDSGSGPWRAEIVKHAEIISYCGQNEVRWINEDRVYLLKKRQMNGMHAELFSYALHQQLKTQKQDLAPLRLLEYESVRMTDIEPHVRLAYEHAGAQLIFSVESDYKQFRIYLPKIDLVNRPTVESLLKDLGFTEQNDRAEFTFPRDESLAMIHRLAKRLATVTTM